MKIAQALTNIRRIYYDASVPVAKTVALELQGHSAIETSAKEKFAGSSEPGVFSISVGRNVVGKHTALNNALKANEQFVFFQIAQDGSGVLYAAKPYLLYGFFRYIVEDLGGDSIDPYEQGKVITSSFKWQRTAYDYFLTQEGRIQRHLDREEYIRELARLGFTHIEVNGLAFPMALETGPKGETYPMFYTYCPALDQFVYSRLNKGLYPYYYLSANMAFLRKNAELAVKYGLTPGLLSFEPRSVPEEFFNRYPMLRGARVDHPFRSFKPRYNMTITHPVVKAHYAEMLKKLMQEIPELGFFCIWTNDSGAGFEHTKSLYVGRNGGPYLIREWKDDREIARRAGENALQFFRLLRDAASEINPDFRILTRLESFYGEHDTIWNGLGDRIEVETSSLLAKGWEMPYTHPKYKDDHSVPAGTVYQSGFFTEEKKFIQELKSKNSNAHYYYTAGPHWLFEPLIGIPYPKLAFDKLKTMHGQGVEYLTHLGGIHPPNLVPFNINHEIIRHFQFDPQMDVENEIKRIAHKWAGEKYAETLIRAWRLTEEAILAYPHTVPLYSIFGFTWYRLWARPFVPNFLAIPQQERAYYEDFMCTTPHNPNNIDFSKDVLFELTTQKKSERDLERIDNNLWPYIEEAISILKGCVADANRTFGEKNVIYDQYIRIRALKCWFMTQRNVAAWITGVHGYMNSKDEEKKQHYAKLVKDMMRREIDNMHEVLEIWDSGIEFMAVTDRGENPLVYGDNLPDLIKRKIALMEKHFNDEPYIEPNYIEKQAAEFIK